jgi:hypothetical protein
MSWTQAFTGVSRAIFIVARLTNNNPNPAVGYATIMTTANSFSTTPHGDIFIHNQNSASNRQGIAYEGTSYAATTTNGPTSLNTTPQIIGFVTGSNNTDQMIANGNFYACTTTKATTLGTTARAMYIPTAPQATTLNYGGFPGYFAEIVIYDGSISLVNAQAVVAYLTAKWSL